ncbi:MAG: thermonuclease family protein [Hyphomicrobiaceae bacterium]
MRKQTTRTVIAVIDGQTIRLDDGREVRLAGVLAPEPPPGLAEEAIWVAAEESRKALQSLVMGKSVRIATAGQNKDRYGRQIAHVFLIVGGDDTWVEERQVADGHLRVASSTTSRGCVAELLAAEDRARRAKRGLWVNAAYQIRDAAKAHELADFVQSFEIAEGRVRAVSERKRRVYLDFGDDWSKDLTAIVSGRDRKRFAAAGVDLLALKGAKVRLRGWVERWNGPLINLTHPEQIEVLDQPQAAPQMPPDAAPPASSTPISMAPTVQRLD